MDCDWADTAKERRENLPESTLSQALSEAEEQAAAVSQAGSAVAVGSVAAGESGDGAGGRKPFAKQPSCIAEEGKRVGSVRFSLGLAFSSLQMRTGARGLRGELGSAWDSERPAGDGWRFKCGIMCGIKCVLRTNTLSPHLVSTLCRIRFVSALCPYALSNAKAGAAAVHQAGRQ